MLPHRAALRVAAMAALLTIPASPLLAPAAAQETRDRSATPTTISGTVYDSLAGKALAGALVQIVAKGNSGRVLSATSDADGEFQITGVAPGSYIIGFLHSTLDSLGLDVTPTLLDVRDSASTHVALAIPSGGTIRGRLCAPTATTDSTGLVIGFVRDADTGMPLGGATVVALWNELVLQDGLRWDRRELPVKANEAGWYALCHVPTGTPITARGELGQDSTGFLELSVPLRGMLHRDLYIPRGSSVTRVAVDDSADAAAGETVRRGSARLTGVVLDGRGKPLSGARLLVWGSGVTGSTQEDGTFALSQLPAGSQALEVRYVGYLPRRVTVDLMSDATRSVRVTLDQRVDVLSAVTVYGKPSRRRRDITGFLQRKNRGFGHLLTRAEIEKQHPFQFTDIFRMISGFMVVPNGEWGYTVLTARGQCAPSIYLDGVRIQDISDIDSLLLPDDLAGIEAYASPVGAPPEYSEGRCGSILVWTGTDERITRE
ncbi:MAG TPA: carboxypeptidase regulatory-like domain-containing protein [Gemmatimonadaceae bacterium]|nr:carboxypeptidase regulatory-like domain-containing protein [Gemmatimonadaceae bacterium]